MVAEEFKKEIHEDIRDFNKKIIEANMECTEYCPREAQWKQDPKVTSSESRENQGA